jgi:hypothetical protein
MKAVSATVPICTNDGLISIIKFVSQFPDGFCNLFFYYYPKTPPDILRHIRYDTQKFSFHELNTA